MSSVVDKTDVTAQLPDEVLCHVFSFLSLKDKLQSEAVNHRFQGCVIKELKANPQPFELNLDPLYLSRLTLNGYKLPMGREQSFAVVQTLDKKAKFSSIWVHVGYEAEVHTCIEQLDGILSLLISEKQCLTKVTSFESNFGFSQALFENFVDKCDKLSAIRFGFDICPLDVVKEFMHTFPMDLFRFFKNRRFTELKLKLFHYDQEALINLFQLIQPNALKILDLSLNKIPELNMAELVKALGPNWSALEEISLMFRQVPVQLTDLFQSVLSRLPALCKCHFDVEGVLLDDQFVCDVTALYMTSGINITVACRSLDLLGHMSGCQIVNMIHRIQNVHPGLVVDFTVGGGDEMILSLGNKSCKLFFITEQVCGAEDCAQCHSFYPCLLRFLRSRVRDAEQNFVEAQRFPNWRLDRCRVCKIVGDLNAYGPYWIALSVVASEDQQSVTIHFETKDYHHYQFRISIGCGACLTIGCLQCSN